MICNKQGELLLQQNPPTGLWGGLWVFPQIETLDQLSEFADRLGFGSVSSQLLEKQRHTFSHFHLDYQPVAVYVEKPQTGWLIEMISAGITQKILYHWACLRR